MTIPWAEVIGDPIAQSKSPIVHGFWLERLGQSGDYGRAHVRPEDLADYIAARRQAEGWRGCNVTLPHKIAIMPLLDDLTDAAREVGAVNTVVRQADGSLLGHNSDAPGFAEALPMAHADTDRPAALIGAGGAARAALVGLASRGYRKVILYNRDEARAQELARSAAGARLDIAVRPIAELGPAPGSVAPWLLANATSLGMTGQPPVPVDLSGWPDDLLVYDMVYAPLETPLLAAARARGMETIDGLSMLIGQAAIAFLLFFGLTAPRVHDRELRALLTT